MKHYKPTSDKLIEQLSSLAINSDLADLSDKYSALADGLKTWNKIAEDVNSSGTSLDSTYNTFSTNTDTTSDWAPPPGNISTTDTSTSTTINSSDPLDLWTPYTIPYTNTGTSTNYTISHIPLIEEPEVTVVSLDLTQSLTKAFTRALEAVKDVLHASISIKGDDDCVEIDVDKFNTRIRYNAPKLNVLRRLAESNVDATTQCIYEEISEFMVDQIEVQFNNHKFNN